MSTTRPATDVKYESLLENRRSSCTVYTVLIAAVVCVVVISALIFINYSIWYLVQRGEKSEINDLPKNKHHVSALQLIKQRMEMYGHSIKIMKDDHTIWHMGKVIQPKPATLAVSTNRASNFRLVCYYTIPVASNDLKADSIDPFLCTHINIGFFSITNGSLTPFTSTELSVIRNVTNLKTVNPSLKIILSLSSLFGFNGFPKMVATRESRKRFIMSIIPELTKEGIDGVDFDWEFPGWTGNIDEKDNFLYLLKDLREEINKQNVSFLVSVAVAATKPIIDVSYNIPEMAEYVDFVNIMAYDFHFYVWYLPITGANAPLFHRPDEDGYFTTLNTNWSISYWANSGMPKDKIVIGIPTYGHSFTLQNANNHGWGAPVSDYGSLGTSGYVTYPEVCWFLTEGGASYEFDGDCHVPYAYHDREWVSYDDVRSVAYKAEYAVNGAFGGIMVYSLNTDDFQGSCAGTTFLLTRQVKNVLWDDQL